MFYPACGSDFVEPIQALTPIIQTFWFVDKGFYGRQSPPEKADLKIPGYSILETRIEGPPFAVEEIRTDPVTMLSYPWIDRCTRTDIFRHEVQRNSITVHRRRDRAVASMADLDSPLGIFFYRRDSNEGGSGTLWLTMHMNLILEKLVDGGLIITDGSNVISDERNPFTVYRQFKDLSDKYKITHDHSNLCFSDLAGNKFTCIGYFGEGYGPVLIWHLKKAGLNHK